MMVNTDGYVSDQTDDETNDVVEPVDWVKKLKSLGWEAVAGGGLIAWAGWSFLSGLGGENLPQIADIGTPQLSSEMVEQSNDKEQAAFQLRSLQLKSGLINRHAKYFLGMAAQHGSTDGHFCSTTSLEECLRSYQKTRSTEMMVLALDGNGVDSSTPRIAMLQFEIESIEVAIAEVTKIDGVTQAFLDEIIPFPEIKEPPVALFLDAFGNHQLKQRNQRKLEEDMLKTQFANQQLEDCREQRGKTCF